MNTASYRWSGSRSNRSACTNRTRSLGPIRAWASASISGEASTAVRCDARDSNNGIRTPGPHASSGTVPRRVNSRRRVQFVRARFVQRTVEMLGRHGPVVLDLVSRNSGIVAGSLRHDSTPHTLKRNSTTSPSCMT